MALSREPALDVSALNDVRVLVVEDTWHVAKAMKGALERLGNACRRPNGHHGGSQAIDGRRETEVGPRRCEPQT